MRAKFIALALTALVATGCDKTTDPSSGLTDAELRAIVLALDDPGMAAVAQHSVSGFSQDRPFSQNLTPTGPVTDIIEQTGSFSFTSECDLGGNASLAGRGSLLLDLDVVSFDITMDATATLVSCMVETDDQNDMVLTGSVTLAATRHGEAGLLSGTQGYTGALDFDTSDGKQGTCRIDVESAFSMQETAVSRSIAGNVCGQSIDFTESWTAAT